jgi:hypothetical protein
MGEDADAFEVSFSNDLPSLLKAWKPSTRISPVWRLSPPGIFVLDDGMGLVAKRLEHIPNSDPPAVRVISDNPLYPAYERTADEIRIIGRIRWFAREI